MVSHLLLPTWSNFYLLKSLLLRLPQVLAVVASSLGSLVYLSCTRPSHSLFAPRPTPVAALVRSSRRCATLFLALLLWITGISFFDATYFCRARADTTLFPTTDAVVIDEGKVFSGEGLGKKSLLFEDTTHSLGLADVLQKADAFRLFAKEVPSFGFTKSAFWVSFALNSNSRYPESVYVEIPHPPLDTIQFYQWPLLQEPAQVATQQQQPRLCGDQIPFKIREMSHRNCVFRIEVPPGQAQRVMLKIQSDGSTQIPLVLWSSPSFAKKDHEEQFAFGMFYGVMIVMALYHLFLFFAIRDSSYLYYVIFVLCLMAHHGNLDGIGYERLWSNHPEWTNALMPFFLGIVCFSLIQFSVKFLNIRAYFPKTHIAFQILKWISLANTIAAFYLPYRITVQVGALATLFILLGLVVSAIVVWRSGFRPARVYVFSWFAPVLGGIIDLLWRYGALPLNAFTAYTFQIGSGLNVLLLSVSLADRISLLRQEKEHAQRMNTQNQERLQKSLEMLLETTKELALVRDRFHAISIATIQLTEYTQISKTTDIYCLLRSETGDTATQSSAHLICYAVAESGRYLEHLKSLDTKSPHLEWAANLQQEKMAFQEPYLTPSRQLVVPLIKGTENIGYLVFCDYLGQKITLEESHFMATLASSLCVALDNLSYVKDREEKAKTDAELIAARAVQESLLPVDTHIPGIEVSSSLKSAQETGGDWYGYYFDKTHNTVHFYIGDVTGHGISSALLTGVVFGGISFGEYVIEHMSGNSSPGDRLRTLAVAVNTAIHKNAQRSQRLMTMAFLSLDLNTGALTYLNAGHNAPFLVSPTQGVKTLMSSGPRLGFIKDPVFHVKTATLEPGDMVFLCTDGLYENPAFEGPMISTKKMKEILSSRNDPVGLKDAMLSHAQSFWAQYPADDDVTVLVFKWVERIFPTEPEQQV